TPRPPHHDPDPWSPPGATPRRRARLAQPRQAAAHSPGRHRVERGGHVAGRPVRGIRLAVRVPVAPPAARPHPTHSSALNAPHHSVDSIRDMPAGHDPAVTEQVTKSATAGRCTFYGRGNANGARAC